jgi:hypothetical protein
MYLFLLYDAFIGLPASYVFLTRVGSSKKLFEYEVQKLCTPELAVRFKVQEVCSGAQLPERDGGIRLFSPEDHKALIR